MGENTWKYSAIMKDIAIGQHNYFKNYNSKADALGQPRGMVWGRRREEGSGWGAHVYLWRIRFDVWQN